MEALVYLSVGAVIVVIATLGFGLSVGLKTWAVLCWFDALAALLPRAMVDYGDTQGIYAPTSLRAHVALTPLYVVIDLAFGCLLWWLAVKRQKKRGCVG